MELSTVNAFSANSNQSKSTLYGDSSITSDKSKFPELFTGDSLLELCNSFWMRSPGARKNIQPYLRGCKWSPDGTCCLSVVNHDGFHVMELPRDLYEGCPTRDRMITLLPAVIHVKESGLVYDFCWYPKMNSHYPETCSWISTKINSPIQMWDAYNGSLRCSYRGYNAVDEMEPAISVTFINQGQRIVGGYKNCMRTFDVERPGRDFVEHKIKTPASCFATHGNLLAVGSWTANIKLFSILDNGTYRSVGNMHAHTGGITHLQFTPDGTKLVSGARKDHNLCVWDVRYHRRPLNILKRAVSTNQRIYFDISTCGRYLVSGGTDGVIRVWDDKFTKWTEQFNVKNTNQEYATFRFQLYRDCCNSISIHPSRPILATGSGQFHFMDPIKVLDLECDSSKKCEDVTKAEIQSVLSESSADEQSLPENSDGFITDNRKLDLANRLDIYTEAFSNNSSSEMEIKDSTKEFRNNTPNQDIAEESPKIFALEICNELPPAKKFKTSNDINVNIDKEIETSRSGPLLEPCNISPANIAHSDVQASTTKMKVNTTTQPCIEFSSISEEVNLGDSRMDTVERMPESSIDSPLPSTRECILNTKENVNSTFEQCSNNDTILKDNIDVVPSTAPTELDETNTLPTNDPDLASTKDNYINSELESLDESDTCHKSHTEVLTVDTDSQFSKNVSISNDTDKSPTNAANIQRTLGHKYVVDNELEIDDDCIDINENKMKYSSHTENHLTFWWTDKIFES